MCPVLTDFKLSQITLMESVEIRSFRGSVIGLPGILHFVIQVAYSQNDKNPPDASRRRTGSQTAEGRDSSRWGCFS